MKLIFSPILFLLLFTTSLQAQTFQVADRIVAVVNDRIVLKSDVDSAVFDFMQEQRSANQTVNFDEQLWYEVLESLINNNVMLEKARIDSVVVEDELVDRQINTRIDQIVGTQFNGDEAAFEEAYGQSLVQIRAEFRERFREQMIIEQLQALKIGTITISRPEVRQYFESIPADSLPVLPDHVSLSHIVKIPPLLGDARDATIRHIEAIRDSIVVHGRSFEEMATRHSDDEYGRTTGGHIGLLEMSVLVPSYSAAAAALEPGEVSGVVESALGFHLIRLNRRVGDSIDTHNILIRVDESLRDEQAAIEELNAIRDSVLVHGEAFDEMARRHSDDESTSSLGGRLYNPSSESRLIPVTQLDQALYRIVLQLDEPGEISEPQPFNPQSQDVNRAFRIIRLDNFVPEHVANFQDDYSRIHALALQQKQFMEFDSWLAEIRDEVYIEYKINVPARYQEPNPDLYDLQSNAETP